VVAALAAIKSKEKSSNIFGVNKPASKTHDVERGDAPEVSHPKPVRTGVLYQPPVNKKNLTIDVIEYQQPNEISDIILDPKSNFDSESIKKVTPKKVLKNVPSNISLSDIAFVP
jgi:hypothetical protein